MLWLRVGMTFACIGWRVVDPLRRVLVAVMKATFISVGLEVLWMVAFKSSLNGGLQKDMLTSQFLRLTDVTLFWKKCHRKCKSRTLRQRLSWTMWVDPKSLWCFLWEKGRGRFQTEERTQRIRHCEDTEDGGMVWPQMSRNASGQLKLEAGRILPLEPPGGVGLCGNLEFGLLAYKSVRK